MKQTNINYSLLSFLTNRKYLSGWYLIIITIGMVITFNMVFIAYQDCSTILGNRIYLICFSTLTLYLVAMWLNYSVLTPRFLLKNKYLAYFLILSAIGFLLPIVAILQEYWVRNSLDLHHRISSYTNPLILVDSLASFMIIFICFLGIPFIVLLRQWMTKKEQVSRMEYEHLRSEINKLKGQITPAFLSKTLTNAETLIKYTPQKTTDMLIKLGQLLRYQLYDCNRERVLLKSEIVFLTNFLHLEQLNRSQFQYKIDAKDNLGTVFISPMLFITIIQIVIEDSISLHLSFDYQRETLSFQCQLDNDREMAESEFYSIRKSLELQYANKYTLLLEKGLVELQLNISE